MKEFKYMSEDRLLRDRYEVIADYPENMFPIGTIIEYDVEAAWVTHNGQLLSIKGFMIAGCMSSYYFSNVLKIHKHPHLFRKVQWWYSRKIEEMPKYVRMAVDIEYHPQYSPVYPLKGEIHEVQEYFDGEETNSKKVFLVGFPDVRFWSHHFLPATEKEFLEYKLIQNA